MNTSNIFNIIGINTSLTQKAITLSRWLLAMRFLLHAGTVLGFTLLLSYFLAYYGATQLPLLFALISTGAIIGTLLNNTLIEKFPIRSILQYASLGISALIFISFFFIQTNENHLFLLTQVTSIVFSIGVTQLNLLFSIYIEESFSPLESEESFPIIESGEPLGGILSGIIAFTLPLFFHPKSLLIAWATLFILFGLLLILKKFTEHDTNEAIHHKKIVSLCDNTKSICIKNIYTLLKNNSLFKYLLFFAILQSAGYILIEIIYAMATSALFQEQHNTNAQVIVELAHGIGTFHLWTYGILFTLQITIASKIQHWLGIVNSFFIQPFAQILISIATLISGSFFIGLFGKGVYEVSGGISRNSYHSSFYAFPKDTREKMKELLDGLTRPIGMLITSIISIIISVVFYNKELGFTELYIAYLSLLLFILLLNFYFYKNTKEEYTHLALQNIKNKESIEEVFDSIEILSQNGHKNTLHILSKLLTAKNTAPLIQKKILETLGKLQHEEAIPDLLWALQHKNKEIQLAGVKAFEKYKGIQKRLITQAFSRHKIIKSLQNTFLYADSKKLRLSVIKVFKEMQHVEIALFLIQILTTKTEKSSYSKEERDQIFCAILGCSYFNDISTAYYIKPFLTSNDPYLKSASIITLWKFKRYKKEAKSHINEMLNNSDINMKMSGIYTIGSLKLHNFTQQLHTIYKTDTNIHIQKHCAIALVKLGSRTHIQPVLNMIFHHDTEISSSTKKLISSPGLEKETQSFIETFIRKKVTEKISSILKDSQNELTTLNTKKLETLSSLYTLINEEKMVHTISLILEKKN